MAGQKSVIANILVKAVEVFKGMDPKEVIPYIEGEPYISRVPVEPGFTNAVFAQNGQRIVGFNTENREINEGLARFDIICYVRLPEKEGKSSLSQIIINVEVQKDQPKKYKILNRAIFYVCRQISSQKERDFVNSNYDDIKSVYSIWICMNMEENSMSHIRLTKEDMIGSQLWKGSLDLFHIVMIGIGKELPGQSENYGLHRLLGTLFSKALTADEKIDIIQQEYEITMEEDFKEDMCEMCNLSQGIKEDGIAIGLEKGREEGREEGISIGEAKAAAVLIGNMHKNGFTAEQIASATDKSLDEVQAILLSPVL